MELTLAPTPNPRILAWARSESGHAPDRVAARLSVDVARLHAWETGARQPTLRQVSELARFYHRPLSMFFQPEPPRSRPLGAVYRRLPAVTPGAESPELRLAIRHLLARRDTASELYEELGYDPPEFGLMARPGESPRQVGERLRSALGVSVATQRSWPNPWQAWREWRAAIEDAGVLVFMFSDVNMSEARGLTLPAGPLPVVAVNTRETPGSRPFTALHELAHLMLANAREEAVANADHHTPQEWIALERFAEEVASFALIDEEWLLNEVGQAGVPDGIEAMRALAKRFTVTPLALATRLRTSGYLTWEDYTAWRAEWEAYLVELPASSPGFASPEQKTLGRCGASFAQLVLEAFDTHRITRSDAARYLNLRPDRFDRLQEALMAAHARGR